MITVFNRKELYITFDMKEQTRIRNILADNGIDYSVKTMNRTSSSPMATGERGRVGTIGQEPGAMYEYKFYVHKSEYDKAKYLIQS